MLALWEPIAVEESLSVIGWPQKINETESQVSDASFNVDCSREM